VIVDVVSALTDSVQPDGYIKDMRRRDQELAKGWGQIATTLLVETSGGMQKIIFTMLVGVPQQRSIKQKIPKELQKRI